MKTTLNTKQLDKGIKFLENKDGIECSRCLEYTNDGEILPDGKHRCHHCANLIKFWLKSNYKKKAYKK